MKIKSRPYQLFLLSGLSFLLFSILALNREGSIDIHVHDTYYIVAHTHVLWILASLSVLLWIIYILTNRFLFSKFITWLHVAVTISALILLSWISVFGYQLNGAPKYMDYSSPWSWKAHSGYSKAVIIIIAVLLTGQILYIVNLLGGIVKRKASI
ncbi:MAG TPA: hypothetical protein VFR58_11455 [Flavisolibacter sp.]|nr:hypothetical protein [Flavisolibacter sp.]